MTQIIKSLPFPGHPREMKNIYPFAKGCQRKKGPCPPSLFIFVHDFRMMVRTRRGGVARRPNGRINPSSSPPLFLRKKRAQKTYGLAATAEVKGCQKKRLCHHSPTLPPSLRVPCNLIGKGVDYKEVGKEKWGGFPFLKDESAEWVSETQGVAFFTGLPPLLSSIPSCKDSSGHEERILEKFFSRIWRKKVCCLAGRAHFQMPSPLPDVQSD